MENYVEQLVAEYYKSKGYFVTMNYWIPFENTSQRVQRGKEQRYNTQSWTDIDILAKGKNELIIIQVKAIIHQRKIAEKIVEYFRRVDFFIKKGVAVDGKSDIVWWTEDCNIRNVVVYDYYSPPSYLEILQKSNIEVVNFKDIFTELVKYAQEKKGVKEQNAVMRLIHFLDKHNYLTPTKLQGINK